MRGLVNFQRIFLLRAAGNIFYRSPCGRSLGEGIGDSCYTFQPARRKISSQSAAVTVTPLDTGKSVTVRDCHSNPSSFTECMTN